MPDRLASRIVYAVLEILDTRHCLPTFGKQPVVELHMGYAIIEAVEAVEKLLEEGQERSK